MIFLLVKSNQYGFRRITPVTVIISPSSLNLTNMDLDTTVDDSPPLALVKSNQYGFRHKINKSKCTKNYISLNLTNMDLD